MGKLSPYLTWGIYSVSGAGKTTLAATAPKPMFLDSAGSGQGLLSIEGRPGFEDVRRTPINHWRDVERAYDNFTGTGRKNWTGRQTIVFDHLDDIQGMVLEELSEQGLLKDERRMADTNEQRDWGIMFNRMRRILRKYKSLPMHKVWIMSLTEDRATGMLKPSLSGQLADKLPYFCDMIGYLRVGKGGRRILSFEKSEKYLAKCRPWWWEEKDRRIIIPDVADNPHILADLFQTIAAGPGESINRGINKE